MGLQRVAELAGAHASSFAIKNDDIRFDGFWVDAKRWNFRDAFGEALRILMIDSEALGRFFEGDSACGRKDADLAHPSAKHFAVDAGLLDEFVRTGDHRADGSAETFGEAEHDGVNMARNFSDWCGQGNCCIEDTRAIEMNF
jgi:hypothetical protein